MVSMPDRFLFLLCAVVAAVVFMAPAATSQARHSEPMALDCSVLDCAEVLPGAQTFEAVEDRPYKVGYDGAGDTVGWVVLSTDVVDIVAYSARPMVTLVGLNTQGIITGAELIHHEEPILQVGISHEELDRFVDYYSDISADSRVVVGSSSDPEAVTVDVISGATVTVLAQNQTILEAAREVGRAEEVVVIDPEAQGHFVHKDEHWSWQKMEREGVFGRLTVSQEEMGLEGEEPFVDLWFTVADASHIGRSLMGDVIYERLSAVLEPGEHLLVVFGTGTSSFKGSGFVRGGMFDRIRLEQGLRQATFYDRDHTNLPDVRAEGAPRFDEGGVFVVRSGRLDPGAPFELIFIGSSYDGVGAYSRDFRAFGSTHQLPSSIYQVTGLTAEQKIWRQAWYNQRLNVVVLGLFLLGILGLFIFRRSLTADPKRLERLHVGVLITSFVVLGLWLHAQPSITQVFTLVEGLVYDWRFGLFLSEPVIFMSWIFLAIIIFVWGRGVFCGWVCPYGAMSELLFRLGQKFHLPSVELPDGAHRLLRYTRYLILFWLLAALFLTSIPGDRLVEVEPFKSTFFIPFWTREWYYMGWWLLLAGASVVWFRPFCRYLCPLGAALALPSSFRRSGPRRRNFCSRCNICARNCEPRAIRPDGTIDPRECLSCMECEATFYDETSCPPLVGWIRLQEKAEETGTPPDAKRLEKLMRQMEEV